MLAITVAPKQKDSARLEEMPEPPPTDGSVLVETIALGICGTDREIVAGEYGWPPPGRDRMILGHESLGRVLEAPPDSGLHAGDHVVGIVRRPDPVPCPNCAVMEWDMCRNGQYTERGIKELDGYGSERFRVETEFAVKVDPSLGIVGVLLEPTTVVAKAWDHIERIGHRARWEPNCVLVTGAGPIGLLAALLGKQRGLDVHVLDRITDGPKPAVVKDLGATYHSTTAVLSGLQADVVVECTGAGSLVFEVMQHTAADAVVCLTGVSGTGRRIQVDAGSLNNELVLENEVVFGSVNANRRHYEQAASALATADRSWLERLITRRVSVEDWSSALQLGPSDVKVVVDFSASRRPA
jgi:threonine dehydrogenase-like Zn-dependent dehydrogenase